MTDFIYLCCSLARQGSREAFSNGCISSKYFAPGMTVIVLVVAVVVLLLVLLLLPRAMAS